MIPRANPFARGMPIALASLTLAASCNHDWTLLQASTDGGVSDSGAAYCEAVFAPICIDFENGELKTEWDGVDEAGGGGVELLSPTDDGTTGLYALRASVPDYVSGPLTQAAVFKDLGGSRRSRVSLFVRADQVDSQSSAVVARIWFDYQQAQEKTITLSLVGTALVAELTDGAMPVSLGTLALAEWRKVEIEATDSEVIFQSGGKTFSRDKAGWVSSAGIRLAVGLIEQSAPHGQWTVAIDNVVAEAS